MALKGGETGTRNRGPETAGRVQGSSDDVFAIEGDGIDLLEMALQHKKTLSCEKTPDPGCAVVRARDKQVSMGFDASDGVTMSLEKEARLSCREIPDTEGRISGSCDGKVLLLQVSLDTAAAAAAFVATVLWKLV